MILLSSMLTASFLIGVKLIQFIDDECETKQMTLNQILQSGRLTQAQLMHLALIICKECGDKIEVGAEDCLDDLFRAYLNLSQSSKDVVLIFATDALAIIDAITFMSKIDSIPTHVAH